MMLQSFAGWCSTSKSTKFGGFLLFFHAWNWKFSRIFPWKFKFDEMVSIHENKFAGLVHYCNHRSDYLHLHDCFFHKRSSGKKGFHISHSRFNTKLLSSIFISYLICLQLRKEDIKHTENPFKVLLRGIIKMPRGMQRICAVQFFAWYFWWNLWRCNGILIRFGWFTFILYITSWVGEAVYGGNPSAPEGSPAYELFNVTIEYFL